MLFVLCGFNALYYLSVIYIYAPTLCIVTSAHNLFRLNIVLCHLYNVRKFFKAFINNFLKPYILKQQNLTVIGDLLAYVFT